MKKYTALGLSLAACLLPFSASAADICLKVSPSNFIFKFKKPSVAKNSATTVSGMFIAPGFFDGARVGTATMNIMARADGTLDYQIRGSDNFSVGAMDYENQRAYTILSVRSANNKTFSGTVFHGTQNGGDYSISYLFTGTDAYEYPISSVVTINCKEAVPTIVSYDN